MTGSAITLSGILGDMTTILTSMVSWTVTICEFVVSNPLLEIFVIGTFALVGIGILKRLIRL